MTLPSTDTVPNPPRLPDDYDARRVLAAIGVLGDQLAEHAASPGGAVLQRILIHSLLKCDEEGIKTETLEGLVKLPSPPRKRVWPGFFALIIPAFAGIWVADVLRIRSNFELALGADPMPVWAGALTIAVATVAGLAIAAAWGAIGMLRSWAGKLRP